MRHSRAKRRHRREFASVIAKSRSRPYRPENPCTRKSPSPSPKPNQVDPTQASFRLEGSGETVLEADGLTKHYGGVAALREVSLSLRHGEIRCLAGENGSGKSTLIKILAGVVAPDSGTLTLAGMAGRRLYPMEAIQAGIQVIYQDLALFPNLTVAENLALNRLLARRRHWIRRREVLRIAAEAAEKIDLDLDLAQPVSALTVAERQLISIARALLQDTRLLIMDEPTTALTQKEVEVLFAVVRRLRTEGMSILFVSHKLQEVLRIGGQITVMRNGEKVAEGPVSQFSPSSLARHMTGREITSLASRYNFPAEPAPPRMCVDALTRREHFESITMHVRPGEIVGLAGLLGSGRTAFARALFGLNPPDQGTIRIDGRPVVVHTVSDAIAQGMAYVPEDRLSEGLFLAQSIDLNLAAARLDALSGPGGMLPGRRVQEEAAVWIQAMGIKTPSGGTPVNHLSGGNQQKVVLGKWLATRARILILNRPTVGVDIGAKMDIHRKIQDWARQGMAVILISDDLPEIAQICHRVLVFHRGRIRHELAAGEFDENSLARSEAME